MKMDDLFGDRIDLLKCLKDLNAQISLILKNGFVCTGKLERLEKNKIRVKMKRGGKFNAILVDTWPDMVAAVKFAIAIKFQELPFAPYRGEEGSYWHERIFDSVKDEYSYDRHDLLGYLLEGKKQKAVPEIDIILVNGKRFGGLLELVHPGRVLLKLEAENINGRNVYLDVNPGQIGAVQFAIGDKGWPYDPTAG
jgi:hypothetical protein